MSKNCQNQFMNFKVAIHSWIETQKVHLSQINKHEDPLAYRHVENNLKDSQALLFDLTGHKSQAFKDLLCAE
jgi:hypothetical protein